MLRGNWSHFDVLRRPVSSSPSGNSPLDIVVVSYGLDGVLTNEHFEQGQPSYKQLYIDFIRAGRSDGNIDSTSPAPQSSRGTEVARKRHHQSSSTSRTKCNGSPASRPLLRQPVGKVGIPPPWRICLVVARTIPRFATLVVEQGGWNCMSLWQGEFNNINL